MKRKLLFVFSIFLLAGSCKMAEKQMRQGDYASAIDISVRKLQRNTDKDAYILVLEQAFARANANDLAYIDALKKEGQPDRWELIYDVYQQIGRRQNAIAPLLPLYIDSEARNAQLDFVDVVSALIESKKNAAAFLYASAEQKLATGNIYDAREAYYDLQKIKNLYSTYKDTDRLLEEARAAGQVLIGFYTKNASDKTLSTRLNDRMYQIEPVATRGMWYQIIDNPDKADRFIELRVTQLEAFPELVNTNNYVETAEVKDGWTYLYDDNGHVVKDSLGNPIKVTKYEMVNAYISETWQEKIASISGEVRYLDSRGNVLRSIPVKADGIFQNYFAVATGYNAAISPETRQKLGGGPLPFPSDEELLEQALTILEQQVQAVMRDWNDSLLNQ
ncbi:MAG: hypothetical protein ABR95_08670 [Sphingobacteriales bacterium BACL12 MAG-120813-bin55]|jgi:hypothetical protein|nr:MAG: hypothetical protein ABR94_01590 [Sphingobacteriales bacterium BACL12 MAG-120802-bin5]KRP13990.1 MAG: hypothetical protein ABR95_08670 [Sphingobacteriales bacterium BACL12 MAG-120813-bin55]